MVVHSLPFPAIRCLHLTTCGGLACTLQIVREFMILENLRGCYLGIAQLIQIVNCSSPGEFQYRDAALECHV